MVTYSTSPQLELLQRVLAAYTWTVVLVLLYFLWRIAFFYEKASGEHVGHYWVFLPALLLAAGAVWYILRSGSFVGEPVGDLLLFGGGILLLLFCLRLHDRMTGERR